MELRQLKYFVKVADTLNFSEAARQLFITQSTLSQQVKQLEYELGSQLLVRTSHSVALTEAGRELLPYARKTLKDAEMCQARMDDINSMAVGTLNIGVTYSFGSILFWHSSRRSRLTASSRIYSSRTSWRPSSIRRIPLRPKSR